MAENKSGSSSKAEDPCQQARTLWLSEEINVDRLRQVESLYRQVWESSRDNAGTNNNKKRRLLQASKCSSTTVTDNSIQQQQHAGKRLALLYLQSGRVELADELLSRLGYSCRLARNVLDYPMFPAKKESTWQDDGTVVPCRMYDGFLTQPEITHLRSVFQEPEANYWTDHNYSVEPPSPYVSYLIPLSKNSTPPQPHTRRELFPDDDAFVNRLVHRLLEHIVSTWKPALRRQATYCEMWAHNRPHASGHQLHFDSDNEGRVSFGIPL